MNEKQRLSRLAKTSILLSSCVLTIAASLIVTYAWASKNMSVSEKNIGFSLSPDLMDTFSNTSSFLVVSSGEDITVQGSPSKNLLPGSTTDFSIGLYNKSQSTIEVTTFGIEVPKVWTTSSNVDYQSQYSDSFDYDEIPLKVTSGDTTTYYYLGTNVQVMVNNYIIYNTDKNRNDDTNIYLTDKIKKVDFVEKQVSTYDSENVETVTNISDNVTNTLKPILQSDLTSQRVELINTASLASSDLSSNYSIRLEPGQALLIEIHILFENSNTDQSAFANFGSDNGGGCCHRVVYADFNQIVE